MYKILVDNILMYDSRIEELALINPVVNLEENKAGSFSFKIPPNHPYYDLIQRRKSIVQVFQDDEKEPIFSGMCIEITNYFYKQKQIYCEGELSFFNDSIQRQYKYQDISVRGLLENLIAKHNEQVEAAKRFQVGIITVEDSNDSLYCYTNMESTMKCLKEDLVDDLGGFFRIRHEDGVKYLDYLAGSQNTNSQIIKLGKNLLDFSSNIDSSDIATAIIPLGAKLEESDVEGLEKRLTIESVNGGKDYVHSQEAVDSFGWIYSVVTWDDVTTAATLKSKAEKYLSEIQFENMVIEAKAVDLHLDNSEIESFKLSDEIRVVSKPHGLDKYFRLTKMTINLNNPENNTITLGKEEKVTLSEKTNKENAEIKNAINDFSPSTILNSAIENATQLIKNSMNGYITTVTNKYGTPTELLIMDTPDKETATKVWRWNINGLGYSSNGYNGNYSTAITMDGAIVADRISTGILNADLIKAGTINADLIKAGTMSADRIKGGTVLLGGSNVTKADLKLYDSMDKIFGEWTENGIYQQSKNFRPRRHKSRGAVYCQNIMSFDHRKVGYFRLYFQNVENFNADVGLTFVLNVDSQKVKAIKFNTSQLKRSGSMYYYDVSFADLTFETQATGETHNMLYFYLGYYPDVKTQYGIDIEFVKMVKLDENKQITCEYWKEFHSGTESVAEGYSFDTETGSFTFNGLEITGSGMKIYGDTFVRGYEANGISHSVNGNNANYDKTVFSLDLSGFKHEKIYGNASSVTDAKALYVLEDGTVISSSSSRRYKEKISYDVDKYHCEGLYDVKVAEFKYKDVFGGGDMEIGLIAEDVAEHFPQGAIYNENGTVESWSERTMIPALLKLIQDQNKRIETLERGLEKCRI